MTVSNRERYFAAITEADFTATVLAYARAGGWQWRGTDNRCQ